MFTHARRTLAAPTVILLIFVGAMLRVEAGELPTEAAPFALAQQELDRCRDEVHKREMKILWPDARPDQLPDNAEVYLIYGYISYTCTRLRWQNGAVLAERVETKRTWFYNASGESFTAVRLTIAPDDFARAWGAARLLLGAKAERLHLKPAPVMENGIYRHGGGRMTNVIARTFAVGPDKSADVSGRRARDVLSG